jgi:hypothetical protein
MHYNLFIPLTLMRLILPDLGDKPHRAKVFVRV